jgi:integrase
MATIKLKYVHGYRDRLLRQRYYFRRGNRRWPLPGSPGTPDFTEEYDRLLAEHAPAAKPARGKAVEGTLDWIILKYKTESTEWANAKQSTRDNYDRRLEWLGTRYGTAFLKSFTEKGVRAIRNKLRGTPSKADDVVKMIGRLWRYAKEHQGMDDLGPNPAAEVARIHKETESHKAWPPELCKAMEAHKSPQVVRAYYLLRYTGQRRIDVARMKASQFDGTAVELFQVKTGAYVWVPAHKRLREHLAETGIDGSHLLVKGQSGPGGLRHGRGPYTAKSLGNLVCNACAELGFPGYSPHGLRHLAGAALAEAGATIDEIMSVLGHTTDKAARIYVQQASRKVMAKNAMEKWEAGTG